MFSACTSIKVAVLLNKVADLPKGHFSPLDLILYSQLLFLRLPCCCGRDLFTLPAGTGSPWGRKESDTTEQISLSLLPLVKMEHLTNTFHCQVEITSGVFHGHIKLSLSKNKFSVFSFLPFFTLTFLPSFRRTR